MPDTPSTLPFVLYFAIVAAPRTAPPASAAPIELPVNDSAATKPNLSKGFIRGNVDEIAGAKVTALIKTIFEEIHVIDLQQQEGSNLIKTILCV
jgi:predicted nucleotide-binding protein